MFKFLGTTDEVTTCDCCGKSKLKMTVAFDHDGEVVYYGSTCASRNTSRPLKEWQNEADKATAARMALAVAEYRTTAEYRAKQARFALRTAMKIPPGRQSADFVREVCLAADDKVAEIAERFNVKRWVAL